MTDTVSTALPHPPKVSGGEGETGHLEELRVDPIGLMQRVRDECGDVGEFRLADKEVVLLTGAEANEVFFRASDDELDQAAAYPFMTPVFGEGVVFDASPEERRRALHNQSLRDKFMRGHAATITREIERMLDTWDDEGTIDLLDFTAELFIYTSTTCLIGEKFREELDGHVAELFHDLERGTDAIAFVDPYADIESFRQRDAARAELVEIIGAIMDRRRQAGPPAEGDDRDLVDVLMSIENPDGSEYFSPHIVTGMFISMMFAGHHTTSTTASWMIIELIRNRELLATVVAEMDALAEAGGGVVTYQDLREVPWLEATIKETLRLHPPLILLLRMVVEPFDVQGFHVEAGKLVGASISVSNRLEGAFDDPDRFDPSRYLDPRHDDLDNPWNWIPFGAGRHRCVGAAFALMQLKTIFCVLLRDWELTPAQPPETYRNDLTKMVVQLAQPCAVHYRRRDRAASTEGAA
jgi:sterol 14-demethylase